MRARRLAAVAALVACLAAARAQAHGVPSTWGDVWHAIFKRYNCASSGCHLPPTRAGGLSLAEQEAWGELVGFGLGQQPQNSAAANLLKMRVDPGRPWNSFIVDKLRGHLKFGEGLRMPQSQTPLPECAIREVEHWILAGAPETGIVDADVAHSGKDGCNVDSPGGESCAIDPCEPAQTALDAPPAPSSGEGARVSLASVALSGHSAIAEWTVSMPAPGGLVGGIDVTMRAGTDYVSVARASDGVPLMIALGDPDGDATTSGALALPAGFALSLDAGEPLVVRQAMKLDRFAPGAQAEAVIDFRWASPGAHRVEPFVDTVATSLLLAPPRALGATTGFWNPGSAAQVVALRTWTDARASRSFAVTPAGPQDLGRRGDYWVPPEPVDVPAGAGIPYGCVHDNTHLARSPRWACGEGATAAAGQVLPPVGTPAALGGGSLPWCDSEADCSGCAAPPCCSPANLVGGDGVEDGRCTLVGLFAVD